MNVKSVVETVSYTHLDVYKRQVLECDARSGAGVKQFSPVMRAALKEQIARWKEKGQVGRPVRAMVVGIPNVGKSTFINKVAKKKSAKAGDRPGVTRGKQWITVDQGLELLDTPGILWPKFEDETIGLHLAFTGAVRDAIMAVSYTHLDVYKRQVCYKAKKIRNALWRLARGRSSF